MDKINLTFNELLRSFFAGVWGFVWLFLLLDDNKRRFIYENGFKDISFLIFAALLTGVVIYSVHRAIIYPNLYKLVLTILVVILRKLRWDGDWWLFIPFYPSRTERYHDFRRWKERGKEKSISSNLIEWGSQVHFLYCSSWALLLAIAFEKGINTCESKFIELACWTLLITLSASFIHHVRYMIYDIETALHES